MHNEIEAQFLDINKDELRQKLKSIGAKLVKPETLMKRIIFDVGPHQYARVRDEGDKIVMTYKNVSDDKSILGTKEINLTIDNYDAGVEFLRNCGLEQKAHQETLRETWKLGNVEIDIDTWPWIPTFAEVEGPTEESVWSTAEKLNLDKSKAKFGSVDTTYQHYHGIDPDILNLHTPEITFHATPPDWVKPLPS